MAQVLVLGGGAREHALAATLIASEEVAKIFVSPGNAGTGLFCGSAVSNLSIDIDNHKAVINACRTNGVDLVVVGPEAPLAAGIVDSLQKANIKAFGPTEVAAQIESSKVFAKDFMRRHGIPTAEYKTFKADDGEEVVDDYIDHAEWKGYVIKASGLAAGKGVRVEDSKEAAKEAVRSLRGSTSSQMRQAALNLVVEEKLDGFEVSILAFTDGESVALMPPAQDYKRRDAGDLGQNTGGMGAYAPCDIATEEQLEYIKKHIMEKTIAGLREENIIYSGVLYAGLMMTQSGPKVLEFNCRFGDPEAQVLCLLLKSSLYNIMQSCINRTLSATDVRFADSLYAATVNVVINSYPGNVQGGFGLKILGLDEVKEEEYATVFISGAREGSSPKVLETSGGRVMSMCAVSPYLEDAVKSALYSASLIRFENATEEFCASYRGDIGYTAILRHVQRAMTKLTYKAAGVDIEKGEEIIPKIKEWAQSSKRPGVMGELGMFGGFFDISREGFIDPVLIAGADGVGSKLKIAQECNKHDTIGEDLVAMNVNDVLMHGAEPLFFLDYFATHGLQENQASDILKGVARGCSLANCSLIGGETAELSAIYRENDYDLAGFAVGAVERKNVLPKMDEMEAGDVLIGISSSGLHSNGYSLVRRIVERLDLDYIELAPFSNTLTLGEALLIPTFIYTPLVEVFKRNLVLGAAHITGGGLAGNILRVIPQHLAVKIDCVWPIPTVFAWLHGHGISLEESLRTFNLGLGVILIVKKDRVEQTLKYIMNCFKDRPVENPPEYLPADGVVKPYSAWTIGSLVPAEKEKPRFNIQGMEMALNKYASILAHTYPECFRRSHRKRVAVLISGTGTNLQALLNYTLSGPSHAEIALVISNKQDAGGLAKAQNEKVPTRVIPNKNFDTREAFEEKIHDTLLEFKIEIVVLAGFMRILTESFVRNWRGKIINIHPSLLPSFRGKDAAHQALTAGVAITGCTVHFVEEVVDAGGIIAQEAVPILPGDDVASLTKRVQKAEHALFPRALEMVARQRVYLDRSGQVCRRNSSVQGRLSARNSMTAYAPSGRRRSSFGQCI